MLKWIVGGGGGLTDQEAENKLLSYNWHAHSGFVDLDSIKQSTLSLKYFIETQNYLENYFTDGEFEYITSKDDLLISVRFKKAARVGIPVKYIKEILLKMFKVDKSHIKDNFKTRFISVFKNRDPKNLGNHVPFLSYSETFEDNLPKHYLNCSGVQATKELLWLLYTVVPNIDFSPILIKFISFSLIFLTKEECFSFLKNLLIQDYSHTNLYNLRFRLRFNYDENRKLVGAFINSFKNLTKYTAKEIIGRFEKIGFEFELLIEDMFFNFFLDYLNFSFMCKFYVVYANEGSKILFRVAYAILKHFKSDILYIDRADSVIKIIRQKTFELKEMNKFFDMAFSYNLTEKNNEYKNVKIVATFKPEKISNYYIPSINGESSILSDNDTFRLWNIFPDNFKSKDAKIIYSNILNGNSLDKLYEICSDSENSCFNCFAIIKTDKSEIFGLIMSSPFDKNRGSFYKPAYISLFTLSPVVARYELVLSSDKLVFCGEDKIIIGLGDNGPALELDKDIMFGFSYKSENFYSPSFSSNSDCSFTIDMLEIFILY